MADTSVRITHSNVVNENGANNEIFRGCFLYPYVYTRILHLIYRIQTIMVPTTPYNLVPAPSKASQNLLGPSLLSLHVQ